MNPAVPPPLLPEKPSRRFLRYPVLLLVLLASGPNILAAITINSFRAFVHDTGQSALLSSGAAFILTCQTLLVILAFAIPLCAIAAMFLRCSTLSVSILTALMCISVRQASFTLHHTTSTVASGLTAGHSAQARP